MPYPATHIKLGLDYANKSNLTGKNRDLFFLGKLLPDLKVDGILERHETHYYKKNEYLKKYFVDNFLETEYLMFPNGKANFLTIGYFFHLLTDEHFIENSNKEGIGEYIWNIKRKFNAIQDIGDNPEIINILNSIKDKTELITKENISSVFQNIEIKKIQESFKKGIEMSIKEMKSDLIQFEDFGDYLDYMELDIEREKHIHKSNLALNEFNNIMFSNGFTY